MKLQEAKKIYFRLLQDYDLFYNSKNRNSNLMLEFGSKDNYYKFGLIPDLAELLPEKDKQEVLGFTESIIEAIKNFSEKQDEFVNKMNNILSNKLLTTREKECQALKLREEILTTLNKLVEKNKKLYDKQAEEFSLIQGIMSQVEEALAGFTDKVVLPKSIDLYGSNFEYIDEAYNLEFANRLFKKEPELADRNFHYYQRKGEEMAYGRHNEKFFEEIGYLRNWHLEEYWRKKGFKSLEECLAKNHEDLKEQEELKHIEELKKELAYQKLMETESESGLLKKILKGITNATN